MTLPKKASSITISVNKLNSVHTHFLSLSGNLAFRQNSQLVVDDVDLRGMGVSEHVANKFWRTFAPKIRKGKDWPHWSLQMSFKASLGPACEPSFNAFLGVNFSHHLLLVTTKWIWTGEKQYSRRELRRRSKVATNTVGPNACATPT